MRRLLRSVMKVPDSSGSFVVDKKVLAANFQVVYAASDIEWVGADKDIWDCIRSFWIEYSDVPTPDDLKSVLERDLKADVKVVVDEIASMSFMEPASVLQHIDELRQAKGLRHFLTATKESMLIAAQGHKIDKIQMKGVPEAVRFLMGKVVPLLNEAARGKVGGEPRKDSGVMRELYESAEKNPAKSIGILSGIDKLDAVTGGQHKGNLIVVAGFHSEGKTTIMMNMVYNAVFRQGFNAVVFSREMTYDQLRMLLYVLHSNHPRFANVHDPLRFDDIRFGRLDKEAKKFYLDVVIPDFSHNSDYGVLTVEPPSISLNLTDIRVKAEFLSSQHPVDMICIDYLTLLDSESGRRFSEERSRLNSLYVAAKQLALSFDSGQGCVVLTGHQINRKGKEEAEKAQGVYRTSALSDTNECERSSDIIIANYLDADLRAMGEAKVSCLKNRDGKVCDPFNQLMKLDYRYIGNLTDADVAESELLDLNF